MHSFAEWLTISKFKPIKRNSKKKNILNKKVRLEIFDFSWPVKADHSSVNGDFGLLKKKSAVSSASPKFRNISDSKFGDKRNVSQSNQALLEEQSLLSCTRFQISL